MKESMITKLSPPWYVYHRKVLAMFGKDSEIHIKDLNKINDNNFSFMILVSNKEKARAIKTILPNTVEIGSVTINVCIYGPDEDNIEPLNESAEEIYKTAFSGNPVFEKTITKNYPLYNKISYCVFKKEVIQFWNDDLSDYCGNYSGLASEIAREIFNPSEIQYCISAE